MKQPKCDCTSKAYGKEVCKHCEGRRLGPNLQDEYERIEKDFKEQVEPLFHPTSGETAGDRKTTARMDGEKMKHIEVISYNNEKSWSVVLDHIIDFSRGTSRESALRAAIRRLQRLQRECEMDLEK